MDGSAITRYARPRRRRGKAATSLAWTILLIAAVVCGGLQLAERDAKTNPKGQPVVRLQLQKQGGMVHIPGGTFQMGAPNSPDADAWPPHRVAVESFWLDAAPVTNAQFADFVNQSSYRTTAERRGHALVLSPAAQQWQAIQGADWRHPEGPSSSIAGRDIWPVVQVSWHDATAFAHWAGKRLPTEAEYEYAARGGLADCDYPWGRELLIGHRHQANAWQGRFPDFDLARDGYAGLAPTSAFEPNRYGLVDMLGNVYCWCDDWYDAAYYTYSPATAPTGPATGTERVQRGGSWLSTENHEPLAVWRRRAADPDTTTNHVGFRCASDQPPADGTSSLLAERQATTRQ